MATAQYDQFVDAIQKLSARDQAFAQSILKGWHQFGAPTPGQRPYVDQLIIRASQPVPAANGVTVGDFSAVIALFNRASQHLKHPKVCLMLGSNTPIILSVAGERSSAPGTISIVGEGRYPDRTWYGRVTSAGEWQPARNVDASTQETLASLLAQFASDPATVATTYGKLTNQCCFCQRELTDLRSVRAGFGPVCADHYGLSEQWANASGHADQLSLLQ